MLLPAVLYKDEIIRKFKEHYYTDNMFYYNGSFNNSYPDIEERPDWWFFQYAIVNSNKELIGFMDYCLNSAISKAYNFGLFSFDRGNPLVAKEAFKKLEELVNTAHRIEWRAIASNPACKGYDSFIKRYNGKKHVLKDSLKDRNGNYVDEYIYEILNSTK